MTAIRTSGVFLMGSLAGCGAGLLLFIANPIGMMPLVQFSPVSAFLAGIVLLVLGTFGSVAAAKAGSTLWLRTILGTIALIAVLLGFVVEVRRRSSEYWGLYLQHQAKAAALHTRYKLTRLNPLVTEQQASQLMTSSDWHRTAALQFYQAANHPWLPFEPIPPEPK